MKKIRPRIAELLLTYLLGLLAESLAFATVDPGVQLSAPVWTNGQVQFTLTGESGVPYVIEHSTDLQSWTPVLTNSASGTNRLITADAPEATGFYRALRTLLPVFTTVIAALGPIDLKGNTIFTDGFDSGDPAYSTNGLYDPSKAKATGDVCTDSPLADSLSVGNAKIKGHVKTGPGIGTITIGANGSVGDRAWVEGSNFGIEPGWFSTDFNLVFPDVRLPTTTWLPAALGTNTIDGVVYSYVFLASGDYSISNLNGNVYVGTNVSVRLKISGNYVTGSQVIRLSPQNAYLQIYMVGSAFSLSGSALIDNSSGHAERFYLFGLPTCTTITFGGSGNFYGCIYAPEAVLNLGGGGSATYDFVGASVTGTATINGHYNIHYDENLQRVGPFR